METPLPTGAGDHYKVVGNRCVGGKGLRPVDDEVISIATRSGLNAQAIGAGAVNQAIKAVAIARGYLQEDGLDVICIPEFTSVDIEGKERTALKLVIEPR